MLPIVLHHGLFGMGDRQIGALKVRYFRGIDTALQSRGHAVLVSRVHPTASVALRASQLKEQINATFDNGQRVILIAHSMGGLDARHMITRLDMHGRVAALLTIATPHRGSAYADWCVRHLGDRLGAFSLCDTLGIDVSGVRELTLDAGQRFDESTPDHPDVIYGSISPTRPWHLVPPWALLSHRIISDAEGDNDGMVSVRSSQRPNHLGNWPADHWHAVNHRFVIELNNPTGDIAPYYLRALDAMNVREIV